MRNSHEGHKQVEAPIKLTEREALEVIKEINDERVSLDEHPEYFAVHLSNKTVMIPRWRYIHNMDIGNVPIEEEIRKELNKNHPDG
jgi:hypothetical protein